MTEVILEQLLRWQPRLWRSTVREETFQQTSFELAACEWLSRFRTGGRSLFLRVPALDRGRCNLLPSPQDNYPNPPNFRQNQPRELRLEKRVYVPPPAPIAKCNSCIFSFFLPENDASSSSGPMGGLIEDVRNASPCRRIQIRTLPSVA